MEHTDILILAALLLVIATVSPWVMVQGPVGKTIFLPGVSWDDGFLLFAIGLICISLIVLREYGAADWASIAAGGIALYIGYIVLTNVNSIAAKFYGTAFGLTWSISPGIGVYLVLIAGIVLLYSGIRSKMG
ncbi:MAG: hypothetical protein JXA43_02705 [Candidatus Diapherotrites archaeon]|nr:hypothetical protein [Candidatus Diapherotrites archaeon]